MNQNDEPADTLGSSMSGGDELLPTHVVPADQTGKRGGSPKTLRENTDQGADAVTEPRTRTDNGGEPNWRKTDQGGDTSHNLRQEKEAQEKN